MPMINICSQVCCEEIMEPFRGLKRTTSQKSMSAYGRGGLKDANCEVFDRQGPAARRLLRQESQVANLLVSLLAHTRSSFIHQLEAFITYFRTLINDWKKPRIFSLDMCSESFTKYVSKPGLSHDVKVPGALKTLKAIRKKLARVLLGGEECCSRLSHLFAWVFNSHGQKTSAILSILSNFFCFYQIGFGTQEYRQVPFDQG